MSRKNLSRSSSKGRAHAAIFAALGDSTRLSIMVKLADGRPRSISLLTHGTRLTRQAVTKHLRVLEDVGIVRAKRTGRESLFTFDPAPLNEMRAYLAFVSGQWDRALARLKSFVED